MKQAKFSLMPSQIEFLEQHDDLGFPDKSALVREALDQLQRRISERRLRESAKLYAEVYAEDRELRTLTEGAIEDWPE